MVLSKAAHEYKLGYQLLKGCTNIHVRGCILKELLVTVGPWLMKLYITPPSILTLVRVRVKVRVRVRVRVSNFSARWSPHI